MTAPPDRPFSIKRLFSPEGFRGPVMTLLSGSAIGLLVAYLAQPVLTRLYTPEEYGLADYFIGVMTVLITVASFRYEDALMTPKTERESADVWWLCLLLTAAVAASLLLVIPARHAIAGWLGAPGFAVFVWLFAPALLLMRLSRLGDLWLARRRDFRLISAGDVANKLSMTGTRIGAVLAAPVGAAGLIGGFILGHVVSAGVYLLYLVRGGRLPSPPSFSRLRQTAVRFRRYPAYSMPAAMLAAIVGRLPILLLPLFFAFDVVGQFGRAFTVLAVPLGVLGGAVAQVFFVASAEVRGTERLSKMASDVHGRLVMLGMFPTLALILAGPDLFAFVLGEPWREAGEYVRLIGPWLYLGGIAAPLTRLFDVLERQRLDLLTSVLMFVLLLSAMIYGGSTGDIILTLTLIGVAGALSRVAQIVTALHIANVPLNRTLRAYFLYFAAALPGLLILYVTAGYNSPPVTLLGAVAGGVVYLAIVGAIEYRSQRKSLT
jgi:lipopolysaccharide exporter